MAVRMSGLRVTISGRSAWWSIPVVGRGMIGCRFGWLRIGALTGQNRGRRAGAKRSTAGRGRAASRAGTRRR